MIAYLEHIIDATVNVTNFPEIIVTRYLAEEVEPVKLANNIWKSWLTSGRKGFRWKAEK